MSKNVEGSDFITTDSSGVTTQRFAVRASNGEQVKFPQPFKGDNVTVIIPNHYNGDKFITAGYTGQGVKDRYGFTISRMCVDQAGTPFWDGDDSPLEVIAIGK